MHDLQRTAATYDDFAQFYDKFTAADDYDAWFKIITDVAEQHGVTTGRVWDVGTGTGKVAARFAADAWEVFASDVSAEMIAIARTRLAATSTQLFVQDVRNSVAVRDVDLVTAIDDVFNHMLTFDDATAAITQINHALRPGGLLIFDVNTVASYTGFFSSLSVQVEKNSVLISEPFGPLFEPGGLATLNISSFAVEAGAWTRKNTRQTQKHHTHADTLAVLKAADLDLVMVYGLSSDGTLTVEVNENLQGKAIYVARKR